MALEVHPKEVPHYGVFPENPGLADWLVALDKSRDLPRVDIRSKIKAFTWSRFAAEIVEKMGDLVN